MMMILAIFFLLSGTAFALIAAVGVVRMPDLYCRMHAATKAGAFGVTLILLGLVCLVPAPRVIFQSVMIIAFFYLTAPIAAHMIGRVGLQRKTTLWRRANVVVEAKPMGRREQGGERMEEVRIEK